MPRVISNTGRTYGKQLGAGVLTSVAWGLVCVVYDFFDLNNWLFPFLSGFSLKALLTTSLVGLFILVMLGLWVFSPTDIIMPEQRLN